MPTEIAVALIALAGVVFSVIVSVLVSMRQTNTELERLRVEIRQIYTDKLVEKRLEVYPAFYALLSSFAKEVSDHGVVTNEGVVTLRAQLSKLDSKCALLFSSHTGHIAYNFRLWLKELAQQPDQELRQMYQTPESIREIRHKVDEFEVALKSDIGIYTVELSDTSPDFQSYKEVNSELARKKTHRK
jgi:hypothetical protein